MYTRSDGSDAGLRREPVDVHAVLDETNLDWLEGVDDARIETHWTRILACDLEANDDRFGDERRVPRGVAAFAKAMLAVAAAYALAYLTVAAIVYAAQAPDPASVLVTRPTTQRPAPTTDIPVRTEPPLSRAA